MAKYRDHRGSLSDSMKTVQEFEVKADLTDYLQKDLDKFGFKLKPGDVKIRPYGHDSRINWNTHIVTIDHYGVAGFTDGILT